MNLNKKIVESYNRGANAKLNLHSTIMYCFNYYKDVISYIRTDGFKITHKMYENDGEIITVFPYLINGKLDHYIDKHGNKYKKEWLRFEDD